jgi:hypothetical protein
MIEFQALGSATLLAAPRSWHLKALSSTMLLAGPGDDMFTKKSTKIISLNQCSCCKYAELDAFFSPYEMPIYAVVRSQDNWLLKKMPIDNAYNRKKNSKIVALLALLALIDYNKITCLLLLLQGGSPRSWQRHALGSATLLAAPRSWQRHALGSATLLAAPRSWQRHALVSATLLAAPRSWQRHALGVLRINIFSREHLVLARLWYPLCCSCCSCSCSSWWIVTHVHQKDARLCGAHYFKKQFEVPIWYYLKYQLPF